MINNYVNYPSWESNFKLTQKMALMMEEGYEVLKFKDGS